MSYPAQLNTPCGRCGRRKGDHYARLHLDDCTWSNDARSSTYDQAEQRAQQGIWTGAQWEAYRRLHPYSRDRWFERPPRPDVAHYIELLTST